MASIEFKNVTVAFEIKGSKNYVKALDNFSTIFDQGDINIVLGKSGSGKTTLLNAILGNILINGNIFVNGINTNKLSTKDLNISYVSQDFALYPQFSAFENIAFPLKIYNISSSEINYRVKEIADLFRISDILGRLPKQLSIGQKQRVALARAFIKRSDLYLFDEPFSNLDHVVADEIRLILKEAIKRFNATAIFVTHDVKDVFLLGDQTYILDEGKLIFKGTSEEMLKCKNKKVSGFLKTI